MHTIAQYFPWEITAHHNINHVIVFKLFYLVVSRIFVRDLMID